MLILFDQGTPASLLSFLKDHTIKKTKEFGWDTLSNGELLNMAEKTGFEVLLTADRTRYQKNQAWLTFFWNVFITTHTKPFCHQCAIRGDLACEKDRETPK